MNAVAHTATAHSAQASTRPVDPGSERAVAEAWRILGLVNSLIQAADTKAGMVLATSGVAGGILYSLVHGAGPRAVALSVFTAIIGLLLTASAVCAGFALRPRRDAQRNDSASIATETNLLFFDHIAQAAGGRGGYINALHELLSEPEELAEQLARQIWANSTVASAKYTWVGRALTFLWWAVPAFAVLAMVTAL